jgi:small subunit ribosomal protein S6
MLFQFEPGGIYFQALPSNLLSDLRKTMAYCETILWYVIILRSINLEYYNCEEFSMIGYEILFIIKPHLSDEIYEKTVQTFEEILKQNEGEVLLLEKIGLKPLASKLENKYTKGYYVQCQFKGTNKTLTSIKRKLAVNENVFRHLIVKLDSIISSKPVKPRKPELAQSEK